MASDHNLKVYGRTSVVLKGKAPDGTKTQESVHPVAGLYLIIDEHNRILA